MIPYTHVKKIGDPGFVQGGFKTEDIWRCYLRSFKVDINVGASAIIAAGTRTIQHNLINAGLLPRMPCSSSICCSFSPYCMIKFSSPSLKQVLSESDRMFQDLVYHIRLRFLIIDMSRGIPAFQQIFESSHFFKSKQPSMVVLFHSFCQTG